MKRRIEKNEMENYRKNICGHSFFSRRQLYMVSLTLCLSCGNSSSDSNDDDDSEAPITSQGQQNSGVSLGETFPTSLALSVFPDESNQSSTSAAALALMLQGAPATNTVNTPGTEDPNAGLSVKEKVARSKEKLAGTSSQCLDIEIFREHNKGSSVSCYEFDNDMNPAKYSDSNQETGTTDGTVGFGSSEACLVAFARQEVNDAVTTVDKAIELITGMLCQAKADSLISSLPGSGESVDLSASIDKASGGEITVTKALLSGLAEIDGAKAFRTDIEIVDPDGRALEVHLIHSPISAGNSKGTLWMKRSPQTNQNSAGGNDPNNSANKNHVLSINYSESLDAEGTSNMKLQVRRAAIVNTLAAFDKNGLVNYAGLPDSAQNSEVHAIQFIAFDMNPATNAGSLSYWKNPGGNYNESARGFLFDISADENGTLSGCGITGSTNGVSIRKALAEPSTAILEPVQYWHPRGDQNIHPDKDSRYSPANGGNKITEQCFKQDSSGVYQIDSAKTKSSQGYDVIETTATAVKPPKPPAEPLVGALGATE